MFGGTQCNRWEIGGQPQHVIAGHHRLEECNRWEIGGQPQLRRHHQTLLPECNRWEIGGQPQLWVMYLPGSAKCNRWEIGGQPQPSVYPEADGVKPATFVQCRPAGNGAAYDDRHSRVGGNPASLSDGAQPRLHGSPCATSFPRKREPTGDHPSAKTEPTPFASRGRRPHNRHSCVGGNPASLSDGAQPRLP